MGGGGRSITDASTVFDRDICTVKSSWLNKSLHFSFSDSQYLYIYIYIYLLLDGYQVTHEHSNVCMASNRNIPIIINVQYHILQSFDSGPLAIWLISKQGRTFFYGEDAQANTVSVCKAYL